MLKAFLGKKLNMTSIFDRHGRNFAATKVSVPQNLVTKLKTKEKDGYQSIQIGIGERKKGAKSQKSDSKPPLFTPRFIREIPFEKEIEVGQKIKATEVFKKGDLVDVIGISKGKGFAGVVKRWGFRGGPRTHGQSDRERAPGSIGSTTTPGRVYKGMKMAGRMGQQRVTVRGLEILDLDPDNEQIYLKGAIPGNKGSFLIIRKSKKKRKAYQEQEIPVVPRLGKEEETKEETEKVEEAAKERGENEKG